MSIAMFKTEHLSMIKPLGNINLFAPEFKGALLEDNTEAFTIFDGDKVISILGIRVIWGGLGEVFTIMCDDIRDHGKALYEGCILSLPTMFKALKLRRLQATVIVGFDKGIKFIENLGFKRDGVMRKWTPDGKDVYLYSIVTED